MAIKEAGMQLAADAIIVGADLRAIVGQGSWAEISSNIVSVVASEIPIGQERTELVEISRTFDANANSLSIVLDNSADLLQPIANIISDRFALIRNGRAMAACNCTIAGTNVTLIVNSGTVDWQIGDQVVFNDQQTALITNVAGNVITIDTAPTGIAPTSIGNAFGELIQVKITTAKTFLAAAGNTIEDEIILSGL